MSETISERSDGQHSAECLSWSRPDFKPFARVDRRPRSRKAKAPNRKIESLPTTELIIECSQLQKVGRHRRECGRQLRAYRRHRTDDDNGNECGNETIFNGGRAGLVIHKSGKQLH